MLISKRSRWRPVIWTACQVLLGHPKANLFYVQLLVKKIQQFQLMNFKRVVFSQVGESHQGGSVTNRAILSSFKLADRHYKS